jgi:deoxyribonuclease-4
MRPVITAALRSRYLQKTPIHGRNEHIGEGHIGINAFELFMNDPRLRNVPKIIETPKHKGDQDCDRVNLNRLRALVHS